MTKDEIRFGPAGIPSSAKGGTTLDGVKETARLGLSAMEIEWVRNVPSKPEGFLPVAKIAQELDVRLSVHGPYWINPCALEKSKIEIARRGLIQGLRAGEAAGAYAFVFHPGYYLGQAPEVAYTKCKVLLQEVLAQLKQEKITNISIALETTGKQKAFGTLEEVVRLSAELDRVIPCVDFGHLYCRNFCKKFLEKKDFKEVFDFIEKHLGAKAAKFLHIHFTSIRCNKEGNELNHLPLSPINFPQFKPLAETIVENGYSPNIICETPMLERDALKMKAIYERVKK